MGEPFEINVTKALKQVMAQATSADDGKLLVYDEANQVIRFSSISISEIIQLLNSLQEQIDELKGQNPPPSNTAPSISSSFNQTGFNEGTNITIPYIVTDAEGGIMTAILTIDGTSSTQTVQTGANSWNVGSLAVGSHTLTIQVKDSGNLSSNVLSFNVTINKSDVDPTQPNNESIKTWVGGVE